jgi:hypothetical protein
MKKEKPMARRIGFAGVSLAIVLILAAGGRPAGAQAPSQEEMMKMYQDLATPGPHHRALDFLEGHWKTEIKSMMNPGQPEVSQGTCDTEWILGGRYLQSVQHATIGGMPFEGHSLTGFDNAKKEYFDLWIDNMGTGYMVFAGELSEDGKTFTEKGSSFDPMMQREVAYRAVTEVRGPGQLFYSMFTTEPDGSEQKVMEITFTR